MRGNRNCEKKVELLVTVLVGSYIIIILLLMDKGEKPLQLVDEKEEWLDVTIDGEVDNAIIYIYIYICYLTW